MTGVEKNGLRQSAKCYKRIPLKVLCSESKKCSFVSWRKCGQFLHKQDIWVKKLKVNYFLDRENNEICYASLWIKECSTGQR